MPLYQLACEKECGCPSTEARLSYSEAKSLKCVCCGGTMIIVPSSSVFRVNGFNAANGYMRESINYDGSPPKNW